MAVAFQGAYIALLNRIAATDDLDLLADVGDDLAFLLNNEFLPSTRILSYRGGNPVEKLLEIEKTLFIIRNKCKT